MLLRSAADDVIVPGYVRLEGRAGDLQESVSALCTAPTASALTDAQHAWVDAFAAFQETDAYSIGPARSMNITAVLGFWPVSPDAIERNIAGTDTIDAHYVDALGAGSKGFISLSYVLFGGSTDAGALPLADDAIVMALVTTPRRCTYAAALADHIQRNAAILRMAWDPAGGDFASTLASAGQPGNTTWPDQSTALVELLTQMLDTLRIVKNIELGIPIGHRSTMTSPLAVESPWANANVASMQANVQGVRDLWGPGASSWDAFLRSRDPDLADTELGELAAATAGIEGLAQIAETSTTTFSAYAAGTDHTVGEGVYSRVDAAETTMATDVASRLGLSVAFSDMDGD